MGNKKIKTLTMLKGSDKLGVLDITTCTIKRGNEGKSKIDSTTSYCLKSTTNFKFDYIMTTRIRKNPLDKV